MSMPAFWLPGEWQSEIALTGDEARHFNVLRLKPDARVLLLNGTGKSGLFICRAVGKRAITLELEREWQTPAPASRPIIALALSKAVRRGFFLEKSAELDAWAVWLWQAERSQGALTAKLEETCAAQIRAGAKQCHNPWFPELRSFQNAEDLARASEDCEWRLLPWEQRAGEPVINREQLGRAGRTVYIIGPEGGLAQAEVDCFLAFGFVPVSLGSRVLRCETAATLCLGLHNWASQPEAQA